MPCMANSESRWELSAASASRTTAATAGYELAGTNGWPITAGLIGLLLAAVALYAALAFLLEDANVHTVLPVLRRGRGSAAITGDAEDHLVAAEDEAGVREQL